MTPGRITEARRLHNLGNGYRSIAEMMGATRHQVRHWLKDAAANLPAAIEAEIEPRTAPEFAERIKGAWHRSLDAIFETGRLFLLAKDTLPRGEFEPMVEALGLGGLRTAERLMAIARDPRLPTHVSRLPAHWGTLYELTRLDDPTFQARIADGTIRPDMERRDVAKPINGARSVMASRQASADDLDYYPTPPFATRALIQHVLVAKFLALPIQSVWEPACGEGHMSEVLGEYFNAVYASDIHDYVDRYDTCDFLAHDTCSPHLDWIVTNPPFKDDLTEKFILRALDLARVGVAMFVRCQILEGIGRYERLWRPHPPTLIAYFSERVPLHRGRWEPDGSTATAYCWLVWMKDRAPMAPSWIPPGQRIALSHPDDRARFAPWSVNAEAAE